MSVATVSYTSTHTVSYVTSKMLLTIKEIVREIGLDPGKLTEDWASLERAVSTWLKSRHLKQVNLEVYNPPSDTLVTRWDLDVVYGYVGDGSFWTDTHLIRYNIAKAGLSPSNCKYRILLLTEHGEPQVEGWGHGKYLSTDGFTRRSVGSAIGGNGIGTDVAYWGKN